MTKAARPSESSDLLRLVHALRAIQVCMGEQPWRYLDLSMAQLKAVMLLCRTGRARTRDLADGLNIAPSAATPLVDRLVEHKLARRLDDDKDRRIVWFHPTAKAQAIYDELLEMNEQILAEVIKEVAPAERKAVKHSARLLADAAVAVLAKLKKS
jgi:DNA-binding MarR family transcriptional regulator